MDRILFIIPPYISYNSYINPQQNTKRGTNSKYGSVITDIPLGVLSLSAYVKSNNQIDTMLIDYNIIINKNNSDISFTEMFKKELEKESVTRFNPTIIAISALFITQYDSMIELSKIAKGIYANSIMIAGGGLPTNMFKDIFNSDSQYDALCFGEGEIPLISLLNADNRFEHMNNSKQWITRYNIDKTHEHNFINDLDDISRYDYGLIDINDYNINPTIKSYPSVQNKDNAIPIMTSRGCPHKCCFCASASIHGREMRFHSISRISDDLKYIVKTYGTKTIIFQDDHFMANKQRFFQIINIMKELGLSGFFPNSLALYTLSRDVLEALKSIGVKQLVLAVESGSNRVLNEIMHKPLNLSIVSRVIKDCRELGIYTDLNILIGLPGETKEDIMEARRFLRTLDANWFRINTATPLIGSEMYDICAKNGYIPNDVKIGDYKTAVVNTPEFTSDYIQEEIYSLNLELNFVNNSDIRLGHYNVAIDGFLNVLKAKPDHMFALYFLYICYKNLGNTEKAKRYRLETLTLLEQNKFWRDQFSMFHLEVPSV